MRLNTSQHRFNGSGVRRGKKPALMTTRSRRRVVHIAPSFGLSRHFRGFGFFIIIIIISTLYRPPSAREKRSVAVGDRQPRYFAPTAARTPPCKNDNTIGTNTNDRHMYVFI